MSDVTTIVPPDGAHLLAHATTKSYVHSDAAPAAAVTGRPNRIEKPAAVTLGLPAKAGRAGSPDLQVRRPDTSLFATLGGLAIQSGVPSHLLRRLIIKELTDNGCDAADAAGRPGEVEVERLADGAYRISDRGNGIPGTPEDIAALFALDRPMISSKFWRLPLRGAMGNGIRCVAGACAATNGTIEVTRGRQRVLLRPTKHRTEILSVTPAPEHEIGTQIVIAFGPNMPEDDDDLSWAEATIRLAKVAGPAYARRPSPHWFDAEQLADTLFYIEPPGTTVREFAAGLDGCSGARAGTIAAPFGKNRLCQSMNQDDAAKLLLAAQAEARSVKPEALGPIGRLAFGDEYDGYAYKSGSFKHGAHLPQATVPFLVEAWAFVTDTKGHNCKFDLMVNRTAITSRVRGSRNMDGKKITISGDNLYSQIETKLGTCEILVHVNSPFVPISSIGKNPYLSVFKSEICEVVRLAFNQSRKLLPPDETEPKKPAELKPPPKPKPEVYVPTTRLGKLIEAAASANLLELDDLTVLSRNLDPYRFDTATGHAEGRWFAAQVGRFFPGRRVHLRGLHYAVLSSGDVYRPDGKKYINSDSCWFWLQRSASKAARWLGYVEFDRIRDERNEPPELYCPERASASEAVRSIAVRPGDGKARLPPLETMLPTLTWSSGVSANQPYRIAFIGEKSSLGDVLRPIAREIGADLLLGTGDASDTLVAEMAARAAADGRPLVVLYFADFDPGGWAMPIAGVVTVTKSGRIRGGRRDWRHEAATRSPLPPPVPRRGHQLRCLAVPRVQPQPAGC